MTNSPVRMRSAHPYNPSYIYLFETNLARCPPFDGSWSGNNKRVAPKKMVIKRKRQTLDTGTQVAVCTPLQMIMERPLGQKPNVGLAENGTQKNKL